MLKQSRPLRYPVCSPEHSRHRSTRPRQAVHIQYSRPEPMHCGIIRMPQDRRIDSMLKTPLFWGTLRSFIYFGLLLPTTLVAQRTSLTMPMVGRYEDGAEYRWLHKKVLDSRLLDDMENFSSWSFAGTGEMTLVEVRASEPWTTTDNS